MKLNSLFSDGAVLQRRKPVSVWGNTSPRTLVRCEINGNEAMTSSSITGDFLLKLPPMEAGGPYTMTVTAGPEKVIVQDVMIGEVWLASGQSNMQFPMRTFDSDFCQTDHPKRSELEKKFIAEKNNPSTLRMFTVARRCMTSRETETVNNGWEYADEQHMRNMSAVALFFARTLQQKLGVTVGMIHSSWGGTLIESWTSRATLMANPDCQSMLAVYDSNLQKPDCWDGIEMDCDVGIRNDPNAILNTPEGRMAFFKEFSTPDTENAGLAKGWAEEFFDDSNWTFFSIPGLWTGRKTEGSGIIWIRREISLPNSWNGRDLVLHMGGIDKQDIAYFNGTEIGRCGKDFEETFWNQPRNYSIPGKLVHGGRNLLAVRNYSFAFNGGFGGIPAQYYLENPETGERISVSGDCRLNVEKDFGLLKGWGIRSVPPPMGPGNPNSCAMLFDSMIRPLLPYSLRGVIWYQGEQNTTSLDDARSYQRKMSDLIRDWRFHFEQGNIPFLQVQLANYTAPKSYSEGDVWPILRESQRLAASDMPNAGLAVILDVGCADDIHPKDKTTVGERLAAWALKNTYALPGIVPEGPVFRDKFQEGHTLRLIFEPNGKLVLKNGRISGFFISGDGVTYEEASCVIDGNSLCLTSGKVSVPRFVRYAWANNPECVTLYNDSGFPASSFQA